MILWFLASSLPCFRFHPFTTFIVPVTCFFTFLSHLLVVSYPVFFRTFPTFCFHLRTYLSYTIFHSSTTNLDSYPFHISFIISFCLYYLDFCSRFHFHFQFVFFMPSFVVSTSAYSHVPAQDVPVLLASSSDPEVKVPIPIHPHLKDRDRVVANCPRSSEINTQSASSMSRYTRTPGVPLEEECDVFDARADQDEYVLVVIGFPLSRCRFPTRSADLKDIIANGLRDSVSIAGTSTQRRHALGCHFCPMGDVLLSRHPERCQRFQSRRPVPHITPQRSRYTRQEHPFNATMDLRPQRRITWQTR